MKKNSGFTLVEMMLVLVIIGIIVVGALRFTQERYLNLRIEKTSAQMQQILNAALSYYVDNSMWPNAAALDVNNQLRGNYLPSTGIPLPLQMSPWFTPYITANSHNKVFYVVVSIPPTMQNANSIALSIVGSLPLAYTATNAGDANTPPTPGTCSNTACFVAAGVNIPGDNLNNIGGIKFAGAYHNGACVPAPDCPANTTPEIYPVIASATGLFNNTNDVYPITSMSAYSSDTAASATPPACTTGGTATACPANSNNAAQTYWRVCLQVLSQRGVPNPDPIVGPATGVIMAFTRCKPTTEFRGDKFDVWNR